MPTLTLTLTKASGAYRAKIAQGSDSLPDDARP
jgi:hypothetical protein